MAGTGTMIKVYLGQQVPQRNKASKWHWHIPGTSLSGISRQPLLDACRLIKLTGGQYGREPIGLYRPGKEKPDLVCTVGVGAGLTVVENEKFGPTLAKWKPRPDL